MDTRTRNQRYTAGTTRRTAISQTLASLDRTDRDVFTTLIRLVGDDLTTRADAADLAKILGVHRNTIYRSLHRLQDLGHLTRTTTWGRPGAHLTRITY